MRARDCVKKSSIKNAWLNPFDTMRREGSKEESVSRMVRIIVVIVVLHTHSLLKQHSPSNNTTTGNSPTKHVTLFEYAKKFSNIVECVKSNPAAKDYTSAEMFEKQDIEEFLKGNVIFRVTDFRLFP